MQIHDHVILCFIHQSHQLDLRKNKQRHMILYIYTVRIDCVLIFNVKELLLDIMINYWVICYIEHDQIRISKAIVFRIIAIVVDMIYK